MTPNLLSKTGQTRRLKIVRSIARWYGRHGRNLPWRRTRNPYVILLSEIMLQQTQVARVVDKLPHFLQRFPNLATLARSPRADVIRAWHGLGYNSRAVRLHRLAFHVQTEYAGHIPRSIKELRALPGVGRYTAHALACFAFGQSVAVVDTNVQRVLQRLFPRASRGIDIWEFAATLLPRRSAYSWNQSLMDLGAAICTARSPDCPRCPLTQTCPSAGRVRYEPRHRRPEPSRNGRPNRIYRGRIVQALRELKGATSTDLDRLGPLIKTPFLAQDRAWLGKLVKGLERDHLIQLRKRKGKVFASLPKS